MPRSRITISMPPDVEEKVRAAAANANMPVSQWVVGAAQRQALRDAGLEALREWEEESGPIPDDALAWADAEIARVESARQERQVSEAELDNYLGVEVATHERSAA